VAERLPSPVQADFGWYNEWDTAEANLTVTTPASVFAVVASGGSVDQIELTKARKLSVETESGRTDSGLSVATGSPMLIAGTPSFRTTTVLQASSALPLNAAIILDVSTGDQPPLLIKNERRVLGLLQAPPTIVGGEFVAPAPTNNAQMSVGYFDDNGAFRPVQIGVGTYEIHFQRVQLGLSEARLATFVDSGGGSGGGGGGGVNDEWTLQVVPHLTDDTSYVTASSLVIPFDRFSSVANDWTLFWNQDAVPANNASVRLRDITNAVTLAELTGINSTGLKSIAFTGSMPPGSAQIELQHKEDSAGAGSSQISGATIAVNP
jgi:hypothetical protein